MRNKRLLIGGATYHVTSRTNAKLRAFECNVGKRTMMSVLKNAKDKYRFKLHNFCIMPTHIHLLITPADGTNLSRIIQWIKTRSARRWNYIYDLRDHMWGERFFSRPIKDPQDFESISDYIDQNPVKAGLVQQAEDFELSGAYHVANKITTLIDR